MTIEKIKSLPESPGVYIFKSKWGKVLYIWKAKNLKKRVLQYFQKNIWLRKEEMINRANDIDFIITKTEEEALLLENNLIKKYQPPFNSLLKWDTWYVYIRIWRSENCNLCKNFPKIEFTRYKDKPGIYIGPKPWKKELKKLLQTLRLILKFRTCSDTQFKKWKICSDYIFWLCKGWCSKNLSADEYKTITDLLISFFKWNTKPIENLILNEINKAIEKQNFERAARLRDIYFNIQKFVEKQTVVLDENISWYFYLAKKINDFILVVITYFYNWKLIDILKFKEKVEKDIPRQDYIKKQIENEFNNFSFQHRCWKNEIYWTTDSLENLTPVLKEFLQNQIETIIISSSFEKENILNDILKSIQIKLWLKNFPYKIEALDISHLSWERTSWGLVSFIWWLKYKKWYRKYKIDSSIKWDDYKALEEVLIRRFKLSEENIDIDQLNLPDLFIIDWGKWQLNIVIKLLDQFPKMKEIIKKIDFISIWKWQARHRKWKIKWEEEKIFKIDKNLNISQIPISILEPEEYQILTKARDEAHSFANRYRKQQQIKIKS